MVREIDDAAFLREVCGCGMAVWQPDAQDGPPSRLSGQVTRTIGNTAWRDLQMISPRGWPAAGWKYLASPKQHPPSLSRYILCTAAGDLGQMGPALQSVLGVLRKAAVSNEARPAGDRADRQLPLPRSCQALPRFPEEAVCLRPTSGLV